MSFRAGAPRDRTFWRDLIRAALPWHRHPVQRFHLEREFTRKAA